MSDHDNTEDERCPKCGYTAKDAFIHGDHHLCDGEIPIAMTPDELVIDTLQDRIIALESAMPKTPEELVFEQFVTGASKAIQDRDKYRRDYHEIAGMHMAAVIERNEMLRLLREIDCVLPESSTDMEDRITELLHRYRDVRIPNVVVGEAHATGGSSAKG